MCHTEEKSKSSYSKKVDKKILHTLLDTNHVSEVLKTVEEHADESLQLKINLW